MKLLLPLAFAAALAGCSTTPISAEQAKPVPAERLFGFQEKPVGQYSTLVITRDEGFYGSCCDTLISLQNKLAGKIAPGESARFYVPPGEVIVGAKVNTPGTVLMEREVALKPGETKRYRISIGGSGMDLSPTAF